MSGPRPPSSFEHGVEFYDENIWQKIARRLKEEPLVPLGFAATCYAFYHATLSVRAGDHHRTNRMFRYRIYGQAFTLVAIVAGSYYYQADRMLRKEYEAIKEEQKAKEKNEAWIKELEFRDQEEKERQRRDNRQRERQRRPRREEKGDQDEKGVLESVKEGKVMQELKKGAQDTVEGVKGKEAVVTESVKEGKIMQELKKVAQDTVEAGKDVVNTKKQ